MKRRSDSDNVRGKADIEALREPVITASTIEQERRKNRRLSMLAVALFVLATALAISFFIFISNNSTTPQVSGDVRLSSAEKYLSSHEDEPEAYEGLARAQMHVGDFEAAITTADKGIKKTKDGALLLTLADAYRKAKDYTEAISAYDRAEAFRAEQVASTEGSITPPAQTGGGNDSFMAQVCYGRGLCEIAIKNDSTAQVDLEASTKWYPGSATTWSALGDFYASKSDLARAREAYLQALKYVPDHTQALEGLKRIGG